MNDLQTDTPRKRNRTKLAVWTTVIVCILVIVASPGYWMLGSLASWNGPEDDIAIVYLLSPFVIIHAIILFRCGLLPHFISALVFAAILTALLVARHFEISGRGGYDQWHANRSLESLGYTLGWIALGLAFSVFRWYLAPEPELDEKPNSRSA